MEALYLYLLKSSSLLALFFIAYHFLLRKETFFTNNRWFLLLGLVTAAILPLVVYTKIIWVEPTTINYDWSNLPVPTVTEKNYTKEYIYLGLALSYCLGTLGLLTKFGFDFYNLLKIFKGKTIARQADFKFIDTTENIAPFSYFNTIVYNSSLYSSLELQSILEHEKIHSDQNHTVDVLIARVFCAVFWFNPFIWWYKNAILQNLEFIADREATKKLSDKKAYQLTLLKITTHENCVAITNHFYQSLIKKRIVMLNKNQSQQWNSWKYFLIIPVLAAFMFYFQVKVIAQERNPQSKSVTHNSQESLQVVVDKNTSDEQLQQETKRVKEQHGIKLKFSKIKRNASGEIIAIKAEYKDQHGKTEVTQVKSDEPIQPIVFFKKDNGALGFGNGKDAKNKSFHFSITTDYENEDLAALPDLEDIEAPEPPEAPETPESLNHLKEKRIIIRNQDNKEGKMSITINGETIVIDTDKIIAEVETEINKLDLDKITSEALENASIEIRKNKPTKKIIKSIIRESRAQSEQDRVQIKRDIEQSENDIKQSIEDSKQAERDFEQSKRELAETKRALEQSKKELEAYKKKMSNK